MIETLVHYSSQGKQGVGTLCLPRGDAAPVVLMLHGFTGSRDEMPVVGTGEGVFSRSARRLAAQGLASLRIDFIGSGHSEGDFADTTYEGQIADALVALKLLAAEPRVQGDRIGLLGWSQGGLIAAAIAGRSPLPLATALWAAVADPQESFGNLMGKSLFAAALKTGNTPIRVPREDREIFLKQPYFDGVMAMNPPAEIAASQRPLFVAHGWQDEAVLPHAAQKFLVAHKAEQESWMENMDHSFNATTGPRTLDRMLDATADFFRRNGLG